ncbi:small acid-soluble spore protein K [Terrilactibacillus sp. S3-3]|nr:small acid-soluble spore protein K [Terrilactibacillus sp. S3-3]
MVDKPGTQYSVKDEDELWPAAKEEFASRRANGTIKDHPSERMFSAHQLHQDENNRVEG